VELHLDSPIGHPAAAPQEVQHLIEHRIEVHEPPFQRIRSSVESDSSTMLRKYKLPAEGCF
jgi:hypothetical protein